jgi:osomolarity two-component system sensor histidine kinase SLN1
MKSLFAPLRLDTDSRQLRFETHLDPAIDEVTSRAFLAALGRNNTKAEKNVQNCEGVVVGDEMRLRQVITNLAGNACKFTPANGTVSITTKLVIPSPEDLARGLEKPATPNAPAAEGDPGTQLSAEYLDLHNLGGEPKKTLERVVVRIEVSDTGYGIEQKEMHRIRLFSEYLGLAVLDHTRFVGRRPKPHIGAFNQTEQGRQQGGKGTGLGLALVRQIVKLSGGRLGLKSKVGKGSTFWVELRVLPQTHILCRDGLHAPLALGVGEKALSILSEEKRPANPRIRSMDRGIPSASHSPGSDPTPGSPSSPFLEQRSNPDGLIQLLPRNYDVCNQAAAKVRKDTADNSVVATQEPPPAADEEVAHVEALEVLKTSAGISSRPRHIDLPTTTINDIRAGGPQTPGSASVLSNASRSTPTEIPPGLQVLVVDDDRMTRLLMTRMLERLRCVVTTAENGKQALQLLLGEGRSADTPAEEQEPNHPTDDREVPRDVVSVHTMSKEGKFVVTFLDNQMPSMSGVEMVRRLRMLGREDLIVGVTGNALLPDQEEYLEAGADQYVRLVVSHWCFEWF